MANEPNDLASTGAGGYGLRFMNENWNQSISNGQPFQLRWNISLDGMAAELAVFRIEYPAEGLEAYELVNNLTGDVDGFSCLWTPQALTDELHMLWLSTRTEGDHVWTMSPPWSPLSDNRQQPSWFGALGIPIIIILFLYAVGLMTCLFHHRRRKKRDRLMRQVSMQPMCRHSSVDSGTTARTLTEPEESRKPETWAFLDSPVDSRRPSDGTITVVSSERMSEDTVVASQLLPQHAEVLESILELETGLRKAEIRKDTRRQTKRAAREASKRPQSW